MTNPVILLGTQANGETLPVQVDATGRLVAEGVQGQEGPPGPQGEQGPTGEQGPPGDPGLIQWPPNPLEGHVLTWKNGEPVWAPPSGGDTGIQWSDYLTSSTGTFASQWPATGAFDGNKSTMASVYGEGTLLFAPPGLEILGLQLTSKNAGMYDGYSFKCKWNDIEQSLPMEGDANTVFNFTRFSGITLDVENPLEIALVRPNGTNSSAELSRVFNFGQELVDIFSTRTRRSMQS